MKIMKVTFLGTGTSVGIPVIGCDCTICRSSDLRNRRRRSSVYIEAGGFHIVIDAMGPADNEDSKAARRILGFDEHTPLTEDNFFEVLGSAIDKLFERFNAKV